MISGYIHLYLKYNSVNPIASLLYLPLLHISTFIHLHFYSYLLVLISEVHLISLAKLSEGNPQSQPYPGPLYGDRDFLPAIASFVNKRARL